MVTITGAVGTLRWDYYTAGALRAWAVTKRDDGSWQMTATVEHTNEWYITSALAARALMFVVAVQGGFWRWPIDTLQITDASLTATLGPKEL